MWADAVRNEDHRSVGLIFKQTCVERAQRWVYDTERAQQTLAAQGDHRLRQLENQVRQLQENNAALKTKSILGGGCGGKGKGKNRQRGAPGGAALPLPPRRRAWRVDR